MLLPKMAAVTARSGCEAHCIFLELISLYLKSYQLKRINYAKNEY
jgi:hypothetical protein